MQLGQVVDYCIDYNKRREAADPEAKKQRPSKRKATQGDIDSFFG